ncbi:uncharacterized protein LOC121759492 isoform X1 [Salvia splendens]|uniref:uncharacterized protein LOC121759492 isoform X1 n=1 Tax=Salvia splendens TaxID=180675 RepID=UPI001C270688|nr:uncharacterized protein LOC121759492 isoform X1 [Salvia splendens]
MASEKKPSEGIALLSMYGDEDDEMEEVDEEVENIDEGGIPLPASDAVAVNDNDGIADYSKEESGRFNSYTPPASATPQQTIFSPQERLQAQQFGSDLNNGQSQKSRPTIVDYGHEEGAMSPEAEEGQIKATGRVMYGEQLQSSDGESLEKKSPGMARLPTPSTQAATPQSLEPDQPETNAMDYATNESEAAGTEDAVMVSVEDQKNIDPLDKFLPPPPKSKCSEELQEKISRFLALKKTTGRSFNAEVRNRKEYRNPDFLLHAVTYQDIDQIGSCFSKDVFDPHGYDKSDFYDEIEADMRREFERKEQERKKSQKLEFTPGGVQPGNALPTPKINIPTPGLTAVSGVVNIPSATSESMGRDGRQNKKSKWDKVDVDQKSSLTTGGQENLPAVGAHAALLSAAKAGSGYSAFAQQRRKEAEDRRSSDRKSDRR